MCRVDTWKKLASQWIETSTSVLPRNIAQNKSISPMRLFHIPSISAYFIGREWFRIWSSCSVIQETNSTSLIISGCAIKFSSVIVISDKLPEIYRAMLDRRCKWIVNHHSSLSSHLPCVSKYWLSNEVKRPSRVLKKCRLSSNTYLFAAFNFHLV